MNNGDTIGNVGLIFSIVFFAIIGYKYYSYWNQLKDALIKTGTRWPLHDQKALNETAQKNIAGGYNMIAGNMGETAQMIFFMRSDDPRIFRPLRGIRRVLVEFLLFPFVLGLVLLITATIFAY
jgi:hypothetical protein